MFCFEPGEIGELWLERYDNVPRESRPVVFVKAPSVRQQRALAKAFDKIFEAADSDAMTNTVLDLFCEWVTGWENYNSDFSREAVEDKFTTRGMIAIVRSVVSGAATPLEDKKKFE